MERNSHGPRRRGWSSAGRRSVVASLGVLLACHAGDARGATPGGEASDADAWAPYRRLLERHVSTGVVDGIRANLVDYRAIGSDPDYARALEHLASAQPGSMSREQRFAFWINAYNLMAIKTIVDRYPVDGIKDGGNLLFPIWKKEVATVAGRGYSLDEVEHGILRPEFRDPRVHFAVVCASLSCPDLRTEPYQAERLDAQLDDATRTFLANETKGLVAGPSDEAARVSSIFKWFGEDFAPAGGVAAFVRANAPPAVAGRVARLEDSGLSYLDYDWSLNDSARR